MEYLTPPLRAKGIYSVKTPFIVQPTKTYECIALRKFSDIVKAGGDVYTEFYQPVGLDTSVYQSDNANNVIIVTLIDESGTAIYIPNSYITSFPNMGNVPYYRYVLSVDIGPLPSYFDPSVLQTSIGDFVLEHVGVENAVVKVHTAPASGTITPEQRDALEVARLARITDADTYKAKWLREQSRADRIQADYSLLLQFVKDKGLLS